MSEAVLLALIGLVGTALKIIVDYRTTAKQSSEVLNEMVAQIGELKDNQVKIGQAAEGTRQGTRDIIRYRLRSEINAALKRGYEDPEHLMEVTHLYTTYKSLGGNGVIDRLFELYEKLPLKEESQHE